MADDNRRVKNATRTEYNGIQFRSKLEVYCYKELEKLGVDFTYEQVKIELIPALILNRLRAFHPVKGGLKKGQWQEVFKIQRKGYTPDFIVNYLGYYVLIEAKGFENDDFSSKRKLLLAKLESDALENGLKPIYLEPHNQKQINLCIEFIKNLE